jgi:hypothetical protein
MTNETKKNYPLAVLSDQPHIYGCVTKFLKFLSTRHMTKSISLKERWYREESVGRLNELAVWTGLQ